MHASLRPHLLRPHFTVSEGSAKKGRKVDLSKHRNTKVENIRDMLTAFDTLRAAAVASMSDVQTAFSTEQLADFEHYWQTLEMRRKVLDNACDLQSDEELQDVLTLLTPDERALLPFADAKTLRVLGSLQSCESDVKGLMDVDEITSKHSAFKDDMAVLTSLAKGVKDSSAELKNAKKRRDTKIDKDKLKVEAAEKSKDVKQSKAAAAGKAKVSVEAPPVAPTIMEAADIHMEKVAMVSLAQVGDADLSKPYMIKDTDDDNIGFRALVCSDLFKAKHAMFESQYPRAQSFKASGRIQAPMKPVELMCSVKAAFAKAAPKLDLIDAAMKLDKGADVKDQDVDLLKSMFEPRQFACAATLNRIAEMEFQGTGQLRYIYQGSRSCIMAHWEHIAAALKELGKPTASIVQLQREFRNFGEVELKKMVDMKYPVYKAQQATSSLMYTPEGFMLCESVLDGKALAGLRMTAGLAKKCGAAFPLYRDALHEADAKSPGLPQMNALIRFCSKL